MSSERGGEEENNDRWVEWPFYRWAGKWLEKVRHDDGVPTAIFSIEIVSPIETFPFLTVTILAGRLSHCQTEANLTGFPRHWPWLEPDLSGANRLTINIFIITVVSNTSTGQDGSGIDAHGGYRGAGYVCGYGRGSIATAMWLRWWRWWRY